MYFLKFMQLVFMHVSQGINTILRACLVKVLVVGSKDLLMKHLQMGMTVCESLICCRGR